MNLIYRKGTDTTGSKHQIYWDWEPVGEIPCRNNQYRKTLDAREGRSFYIRLGYINHHVPVSHLIEKLIWKEFQ